MLASPRLPDTDLFSELAQVKTGVEEETVAVPASDTRRVLVVARWPVGGIRTHLGYNYPALAAAGYCCTFVLPWDESYPAARKTLGRLPGSEFVTVQVRGRDCSLWKTIRPLLRSGRFNLVHSHGLTAAAHATLAGLGQHTPLLATLHEPLRDAQFAGLLGSFKRWMLGRALARASTVVTVSEDARANLLRHFPNLRRRADRIQAISNGIDAGRYAREAPATADLRQELGLTDDTTLIGYLGRFMPEKGFPLLMESAARLVRYGGVAPFHIVAFGSSDYRREYQHSIEQQGLTRYITLKDFVPDVLPVLRQLDLVVAPSLWEASSLVSMEAMAAGVPVLGSDCPGLREVLRDTPSRSVKAGDPAALECGLREALAGLWTAEAREFAPLARERFDNRRSARRLTHLYDELTARSSRAAA
jgi:glycosyltransferase involved in cell wall biosynthesis